MAVLDLKGLLAIGALCLVPFGASAQSAEVYAAMRAELSALLTELQELRVELTDEAENGIAPSGATNGKPIGMIERLDALEAELRGLTGRIERQGFDFNQRLTAAEARLVAVAKALSSVDGIEGLEPLTKEDDVFPNVDLDTNLTVQEQADFDRINAAMQTSDFARVVTLADQFIPAYPGGPLTLQVMHKKAIALVAQENWRAARGAYFELFVESGPDDFGSKALLGLGQSFENLGQKDDACQSYAQLAELYPSSAAVIPASDAAKALNCPS